LPSENGCDVYIVDDDPSVQRALKRLLRAHGFRSRIFSNARLFLSENISPDAGGCLLLDVRMPGMSGMDLQAELRCRGVNLGIVFITGRGTIPMSVQAVRNGALDFLEKPFDPATLVKAVREAIACSRRIGAEMIERRKLEEKFKLLTIREQQVFQLVVSGMLNKQVGDKLGIAEKTVKVHRSHVMKKMQVDTLADLVRLADKLNLPVATD
jgi:FixJ family two-component response regulator